MRPLGTGRIDLAAVETRALLRIAQQVVGRRNLLELLLGLLIAGIEIRVQFFCQPPIGFLDLLLGGILFHAQRLIGIGGQRSLLLFHARERSRRMLGSNESQIRPQPRSIDAKKALASDCA